MTQLELVSLEAEQVILGSLIVEPSNFDVVRGFGLTADHFSEAVHSRLFAAVGEMLSGGKIVSRLTIVTAFASDATVRDLGGAAYVGKLAASVSTAMELEAATRLVKDLALRRATIDAARTLIDDASNTSLATPLAGAVAAHIETMTAQFSGSLERKTDCLVGEAAGETLARLDRLMAGQSDPNAISTGLQSIDTFTGGLHRGSYVILAARPSMGKTALACQIALNVARAGHGTIYFSAEMPTPLLTPRLLTSYTFVPGADQAPLAYQDLLKGKVNAGQRRELDLAATEIAALPLRIDDAPGLSPMDIEARTRVYAAGFERQGNRLGLIIIDHLHRLRFPGATNKVAEFTEISARLAELSKRFNCPVLTLAQLNRAVETRDGKRPQLSDLRESGSIEQDADAVLFCFRPNYYLERRRETDPGAEADRLADLAAVQNRMEIIIEKQRSGPIGTIELWADMAANVVLDPNEPQDEWERAA